jgi:hypothetical protein
LLALGAGFWPLPAAFCRWIVLVPVVRWFSFCGALCCVLP